MRVARTGMVYVMVLAAGLVALMIAGSETHRARAFSLQVPYLEGIATLGEGQRACESPIANPSAFGAVRVWAGAIGAPGALAVTVSDANTGKRLAVGQTAVPDVVSEVTVSLDADVPVGRRLRICVIGAQAAPIDLTGSDPVDRSVHLTVQGVKSPRQFSLVALENRPRSMLSLLPRSFHRAGLFRPGWVGTWTFWVLLVGLFGGTVALGFAVSGAALEEESGAGGPGVSQA